MRTATAVTVGVTCRVAVIALFAGTIPGGSALAGIPPFAYIANYATVTVINTATNTVTAYIPILPSETAASRGIAATPDGLHLYATTPDYGGLTIIDTASNTVSGSIYLSNQPAGIVFGLDGRLLYVANRGVQVVDVVAGRIVTTIPLVRGPAFALAVDPSGKTLYATEPYPLGMNTVAVVDTSTNTVTGQITAETYASRLAFTPDGKFVYVTNENSDSVSVIDTATQQLVGSIAVGHGPTGLALTPDGGFAYIANELADTVSVVDSVMQTVTTSITVGHRPRGVAITPDGAFAYVTNSGSNSVSVIDTATNAVTATISAGGEPSNIVIAIPPPSLTPTPTTTPSLENGCDEMCDNRPCSSARCDGRPVTGYCTLQGPNGCECVPFECPPTTYTYTATPTGTPTPTPTPPESPCGLGVGTTCTPTPSPTAAPFRCIGDCDDSGAVTVNEIILLVNIALGSAQPSVCPDDIPQGVVVNIPLIFQSVNNALNGCPK